MQKKLLFSSANSEPPEGLIHFIASKDFSNVNFFENITDNDSTYSFDNLQVYINNELTNQSAKSISASANDDIKIIAIDNHYPWFGHLDDGPHRGRSIDYIKEIVEPFPTMYQYDGNEITSFLWCFYGCYSLTKIPSKLFDNNLEITTFQGCFENCISLASIPAGLFDKHNKVTIFYGCFRATAITEIPTGLFDNCPNVTDFGGCFSHTAITEIPVGLFDNNTKVTNFNVCFENCTILTEIPIGLFDKNTEATSFYGCFNTCSNLTSIPVGLFDNNTKVTNFNVCFENCTILTEIPIGLFDKNTEVTDFYSCFYNCSKLTPIAQIGSTASSVDARNFANGCASKGTVYCKAGSAAYTAFSTDSNTNVNVLTY